MERKGNVNVRVPLCAFPSLSYVELHEIKVKISFDLFSGTSSLILLYRRIRKRINWWIKRYSTPTSKNVAVALESREETTLRRNSFHRYVCPFK